MMKLIEIVYDVLVLVVWGQVGAVHHSTVVVGGGRSQLESDSGKQRPYR